MLHRRWIPTARIPRQSVRYVSAGHWTNAKLTTSEKYPLTKTLTETKQDLENEAKPAGRKSRSTSLIGKLFITRDETYSSHTNSYVRTQIVSPELCGTSSSTYMKSDRKRMY